MSQEYVFDADDVTIRNLNELSVARAMLDERRILELRDIVAKMVDVSLLLLEDGLSIYEILSFFVDGIVIGDYPIHINHEDDCREALNALTRTTHNMDQTLISEIYVDSMRESGLLLTERDFLPSKDALEVLTYVKNQYSDEAYDVFSQDFREPKVLYSLSFRECVQAITSAEAGYCLFPLEEKGGARLHTIAELIYRNDLKINSVTPVFGFDADADIKYALVSNHFTVPECTVGDDRYLELRLSASQVPSISDILSSASLLGMSVYRVNTVTFDTEGDENTFFSLVLRDGGRDFTPFLTYLALFAPDAVPVGIYKNLE